MLNSGFTILTKLTMLLTFALLKIVQTSCNELKIMFKQSLDSDNIDHYRPECILRSRDKVKLKTRFSRITKIQRSPFYRGVQAWNSLPLEVQNEKNSQAFKNIVNRYDFGI